MILIGVYVRDGVVEDILADQWGVEAIVVNYGNSEDREFKPVHVDEEYVRKTLEGMPYPDQSLGS